MKRRVMIGVAALAVLIVAGWLIHSCASSKKSFVYSGTIETREIQIGSKIGGRVIAGSRRRGPGSESRNSARAASNSMN